MRLPKNRLSTGRNVFEARLPHFTQSIKDQKNLGGARMNESVRELFEKVKQTANQAGQVAGRTFDSAKVKAGELWEITKINGQISNLGLQQGEVLREIGQMVYDAYKDPNTNTDQVDELLEAIDKIKSETAELRRRAMEIKQVRVCSGCGLECALEDRFCKNCGEDLQ